MSDAIKCDRCGEFETHAVNQSEVDLQLATVVEDEGDRTFETHGHDLCTACTKALQAWLRSPPPRDGGKR